MLTKRVTAFLQIRPGEGRMVALIAALFALIDASRGFGPNAVDALFFRRFGVEFLPYMYMGLGAVNLLVTIAYTAGLSRFDPRRFFVGLLGALTLVLLLERAAILLDVSALYPVLWLTIRMLSAILGTFMWHLAGDVTDTRQAKRLFSLFTSAGIAGGIVGNLVTGPAAQWLGTDNLLIVYAGALVACLLLTRSITREFLSAPEKREQGESFVESLQAGFNFVRGSSLLKLIAFSSVLFSILYFSISFLFSQAVAESVPDEAAIAGFLGVFNSVATTVTLMVSLLLANRLYARIGLVNAVFILPVTYVASFALLGISFSLPSAVAVRFGQRVFLSGVASTAWSTFFNVVPSGKRAQVRTFNFGIPEQVGTVLSGMLLILGQTILQRQQVFLIGLGVALLCAYLVWRMRRGYGEALVDALRAGRFEVFSADERAFAGYRGDANAIHLASAALEDENAATRRLGIEILAQMGARSAIPALEKSLSDEDPEVRVAAVRGLSALGARRAAPSLVGLLRDPSPEVRASALDALPALQPDALPALPDALESLLADPDYAVQAKAAVALAVFGQSERVGGTLESLLENVDAEVRILALRGFGDVAEVSGQPPTYPRSVIQALYDDVAGVRLAACETLAQIEDETVIAALAGSLDDTNEQVREAAAQALKRFGERATGRVLEMLQTGQPVAKDAALDALDPDDPQLAAALHDFGHEEIDRLGTCRGMLRAIPHAADAGRATKMVCELLETRAAQSEQRLVKTVGLLGDPGTMELVGRGLQADDSETRAAAVEALETLGEKHLAKEIIPLLEDVPTADGTEGTQALTASGALERLMADDDGLMRAVAASTAGELGLRELAPGLRALDADLDAMVREAAQAALARLEEDGTMETLQTVSSLERVLLLREVPLFAALTPEDLKHIADVAHEELYHDGDTLVREGNEGTEMYVLAEGQVRVVKDEAGEERLLATRGVGDFIGEMAIIESEPRFATVRAEGEVRVLVIDADAFDAILRDRPEVVRALLRGLSRRLREQG